MELILIVLTGTLMGALNFGFFLLGQHYKRDDSGVELTKQNAQYIQELMEWQSYGGVNENRTN